MRAGEVSPESARLHPWRTGCESVQAAFRTPPRTNPQRPGPPRNTPVRLVTFRSPKAVPGPYAGVMKTLVSKDALNRMALCVCFLSALPIARGAEPITIAMTADHWQTKENAEFLRQLGFYHGLMRLNSGNAVLKDITFSDGTIEFDVNTIGRGIPGIAFRQQDEEQFRAAYTSGPIRPVRPSGPACSMRRRLMVSCSGTSFRNIKRGRRCGRTGGTTSRWSYPAGG